MTAIWDPTRLAQLLSNLFGNAAQHGVHGAPIELAVTRGEASVILEVSNGLSVPVAPEQLGRVFEPFQRSQKSKGLGLGLHVVQAIATAHGGTATVTSDGQLICFRVELPRA